MMECGTILQRLSAYLEGSVCSEEKKSIEEHLLSCQPCSSVLRELKRAGELVRDLKAVEPPAWMTQKVLARIRREQQAKKGIFEKLFFPLRIKVPIQATATVLIAVLAIYVFRVGEPELRKVQSPTVSDEVASKVEDLKQPTAPAAKVPAPEAKVALKEIPKPSDRRDVSRPVEEKDKEEMTLSGREKDKDAVPSPEAMRSGKREDARTRLNEAAKSVGSTGKGISSQPIHPVEGVGKAEEYGAARDSSLAKERKAPAAVPPLRAAMAKREEVATITVQVRDVRIAVGEIEDLLRQLGATRVDKESIPDGEAITTEVPSEKIEEFMEKLRSKGEIKEKEPSLQTLKGETRIRVEILSAR